MKIVLLDIDGTVIEEPLDSRVESTDEVSLFPDTLKAMQLLADNEYSVIFITNQAGIAEGLITDDQFWQIQETLIETLEQGSDIDIVDTYMNGEAAGDAMSNYRKPNPDMLLEAEKEHGFKLSDVYMAGDRVTDVEAANRAGCKGGILIKRNVNTADTPKACFTAYSLLEAMEYVVEN